MRLTVMVLLLTAWMNAPATATIIHVPSEQPTIQAGIDAASAGDTVLVAPGTYAGPGNRDLSFGGTDLVLRSSAGPAVTIIDCQTQGRGLVFQNEETMASAVGGFTIRNGLAAGTYGGAILIEGGATPTIRDCRFDSNHANAGGAIHVTSGAVLSACEFDGNTADNYGGAVHGVGATLELAGCEFSDNEAGFGAAVYVHLASTVEILDTNFTDNTGLNLAGGIYGSGSALTFRRCNFTGNMGKVGAGVHLLAGTASVDSCTFSLNSADYAGGGMYAEHVEALTVTGCTFAGNETLGFISSLPVGGGGFYCVTPDPPATPPYIAHCMFVENRSLGPQGSGGGLSGGGGGALVERCTFLDNYAGRVGGGCERGGVLRDCVFQGNTTAGYGGGSNLPDELIDCQFIDNHAGEYGGGAFAAHTVTRCEFSGNSAGNRGGGLAWTYFPAYTIEGCRFTDNVAPEGGGMFLYSVNPSTVAGCTLERNTGFHEGGAAIIRGPTEDPAPVTFSGCTLVGNGSPLGAGGLNLWIPVEIENTIIAFGTEGEAITCTGIGLGVISCTDIYGNTGGDWTGCIAEQLGINGNFSADPLFCNLGAGDYTLAESSPCAPEHSPAGCGLIGASPVACVNPIGVAVETAPPIVGRLRVTPNPIRGSATIEWVNDGRGTVSLRLYDSLGRLVTNRDLGLVPAGRQEMGWDGLVGDRRLRSGVYHLELSSPRRTGGATARVIVIH